MKKLFNLKDIKLVNFIFLTLSGTINAVGVTLFLTPLGLYDGGFSGTSFMLSQFTPLAMSIFLIVLNIPFFLFGFKKLGLSFIVYSIYAIGIYSIWAYLFQHVIPIDFTNGSPIAGSDMLLCALFGGLISGVGSGLTIRFGGAIDGVEVMAVVFSKRLGLTVGSFVMIYNAVLFILAGFLFRSFTIPLYSLIAYAIGIKSVDFVVEGFDKGKSAFIITNKYEEVATALNEVMQRGLTIIDAQGFYSKQPKKVVYCVVNRFELARLKRVVHETDPDAFVAVNDVTDSLGSSLKFNIFKKNTAPKSDASTLNESAQTAIDEAMRGINHSLFSTESIDSTAVETPESAVSEVDTPEINSSVSDTEK